MLLLILLLNLKSNFKLNVLPKKSLFIASLLLAISSLVSRGLGVFRDHLFATNFGTDGIGIYSLDTYYAAFRIPDLLYSILIYGTISVAFIPIFSEHLANKKHEEAWKFTSNVLNLLLLIFACIALIIFIFAKPFLSVFVGGFSPAQIEQTVHLVRIMLLSPLFFAIAAIAIGVENSFQKFTMQALAPVLYNLGIIGGSLLWGAKHGVYGLVWGVVIGAFLYMIIQIPSVLKSGFKWFPILSCKRADTRKMFKLVIPRIIGLSAMQVNLLVDTFIGSALIAGSLTVLNLAQNLQSLPFGIISISLAITSFSLFAKLAAEKNFDDFGKELQKSVRQTLYLLIPAIIGMFLLRKEIISLVFEGGAFDAESTKMTAKVLSYFLIALLAQGLIPLFARAFFALQNTITPLIISLTAMVINIAASFYFSSFLGVAGLAIANAIGMWINMSLLYYFLNKKFTQILTFSFLFKVITSTTIMSFVIFIMQQNSFIISNNFIWRISELIIITLVGSITYLFLTNLFKISEAKIILHKLLRK